MEKCFDGMTVLLPGFVNCGVSETLIDGLMQKGVKDLHVISNNTSIKGQGIGRLVHDNRIKHITCSHIGNNTETVDIHNSYSIDGSRSEVACHLDGVRSVCLCCRYRTEVQRRSIATRQFCYFNITAKCCC